MGVDVSGTGGSGLRNPKSSTSDSESMMMERLLRERMEPELVKGTQQLHRDATGVGGGVINSKAGLLGTNGSQFITLKTFSGKIRKIQKREFLEKFQQGEYYPPEGCTVFSDPDSSTFYVYGGARASKPGHWGMADVLFQITTEKMAGQNNARDIVSFKMFNQSESKTSQFLKLFGASGLSELCSEKYFKGFVVNGKNLDCPNESKFISNEIQIVEIVSNTTFRSTIVRSGKDTITIDKLKSVEVVQSGDIPVPSYGSCLVRVPSLDSGGDKCGVKIGGAVLANRGMSDVDFLFCDKPMWEEESSSEIHILNYNVDLKKFDWKEVKCSGFEPRAFHSAVVIGNFIYVFGGLNIKTGMRYSINPCQISLSDWTVSEVTADGLHGHLSGAGITASADHIYIVGGYTQPNASEKDKPSDTITQIALDKEGENFNFISHHPPDPN